MQNFPNFYSILNGGLFLIFFHAFFYAKTIHAKNTDFFKKISKFCFDFFKN